MAAYSRFRNMTPPQNCLPFAAIESRDEIKSEKFGFLPLQISDHHSRTVR